MPLLFMYIVSISAFCRILLVAKGLSGCKDVSFSAKEMQSPVFMRYTAVFVAFTAAEKAWSGCTSQDSRGVGFRKFLVGA